MFALTKILTRLLLPLSAIFLLLVASLGLLLAGRRRAGLAALVTSIATLYLLSVPVVSTSLRLALEQRHPPHAAADAPAADAIVVLGGGLSAAEPPRPWPDLNSAADRAVHGARLYRAGKAPLVVATGGARLGGTLTQAAGVADLLVELGVPREAILTADASRNTYEDALGTRRLLAEREAGALLLVTSALHMPRALATFRAAGLQPIPSPTDFEVSALDRLGPLAWIPDPEALQGSSRAVKEVLGCFGYALRGWIESPESCLAAPGPSKAPSGSSSR